MFNWRELPFVRLLIPLIVGILLSYFFHFNNWLLIGSMAVFLPLLYASKKVKGWYRHRWLFGALAYLFFIQLGYQIGQFHDERNASDYFEEVLVKNESLVVATITDAPIHKGQWVRLKASIQRIGTSPDSLMSRSGNLLLYVARDSISEGIAYGNQLFFTSQISKLNPPGNPHSFDFQRYLHFQNIHHQAFIRAGDWQVLSSGYGLSVFGKAINLQGQFLATLRKHLDTPNEFAVGSALILGYRNEIPEEVQTAYSQTGAMHVLAVSGLHVGIVFLLLNFFLKKIKLNLTWWRFAKAAIVLVGIWGFALVTGASPSVTRAAVMFTCVQGGIALQRDPNIYNTLALSAFLMLIYDPFLLASVSFQLSYLAVFGIVFFQPRFVRILYVHNIWLRKMWQLICVSLSAQLMLAPLTFLYFHQFPTYFWLTSLLLVPLAGFELAAGLLLLLTEAILPAAAVWVGKVLWGMLKLGNEFVLLVQGLPAAVFDGIWIGGTMAVLLYIILTTSMLALASRKFRWAISGLVFLLAIGVSFAITSWERTEARQVVIYDVYKHTAIDVFEQRKVVSITSQGIDEKTLGFATEVHRFAMGMDELHQFSLNDTGPFAVGNFFFESGFLQFFDLRLAVVQRPIDFEVREKMQLDYVLLRGSPKVFIEEIQSVFEFKKIIFDTSNKKWQVEKWKTKCEELGVEFYDIAADGAFVFDIKK